MSHKTFKGQGMGLKPSLVVKKSHKVSACLVEEFGDIHSDIQIADAVTTGLIILDGMSLKDPPTKTISSYLKLKDELLDKVP